MVFGRPTPRGRRASKVPIPSVSVEDVQLIERTRAGQTEAYGDLVRKYQDRVFNACWRICGHLEDARDITQEAFLKAFENLAGFRRDSGFFTWVFRIAVNLALSKRREVARRRLVSLEDAESTLGGQARELIRRTSRECEASESEEKALRQGCLARAIQELDSDFRTVVVLRDIEGMDYQTIAEILEVPEGTVKSRLHRARMVLADSLRAADGHRPQ